MESELNMESRYTKNHYKMREVVDLMGVPATTIRFWEKEFKELNPKRTLHNQRTYSPGDLEILEIIKYLLVTKGLKLEAAKEYLSHNKKNLSRKLEVIAKLENVREELEVLLHSMNLRGQKMV